MSQATNYHVRVQYDITDRASKALGEIEGHAKKTAQEVTSLRQTLMAVGGMFVGGRIFNAAKSSFIDFNQSLESSRIVMAGMLQLNVGGEWTKNMDHATKSVERFQQMAKKSSLTTKDLVDMASMIERPLLEAGVGMRDIEEITFGAANAAQAFGMNPSIAAFDIQQALAGTVTKRDRFVNAMLAQKGINMDADKFNKLSSSKRVGILTKAFKSDAIKQMAEAQAGTFGGVVSTMKDNIEMGLGKIGLPLFKSISKEIQRWNEWMDRNQGKIEKFSDTVAKSLVSAFQMVKSALSWVYDHADTLITLGKVWAAVKIGGFLGNVAAGLGNSAGGIANLFKKQKGDGAGAIAKSAFENIGSLLKVGAGSYAIATMLGFDDAGRQLVRAFTADGKLRNQIDAVVESMSKLDDAVLASQDALRGKKGAEGTSGFGAQRGLSMLYADQINALKDWESGRLGSGMHGKARAAKRFQEAGIDLGMHGDRLFDPQYRNQLIEKLTREKSSLDSRSSEQQATTDRLFEEAMSSLTDEQRRSVDEMQALNKVFEYVGQQMNKGGAFLITPMDIAAMLVKMSEEGKVGGNQAKKGDTHIHNLNINTMTAKDPDRWLAQIDEHVGRAKRAPRRAKSAIAGGY